MKALRLHEIVGAPDPQAYDGKPYYCTTCGHGWDTFMACERSVCELESASEARRRQDQRQRVLNMANDRRPLS